MKRKLFLIIIAILPALPLALPAQSYAAFPLGITARAQDLATDNNGNLHLVWVTSTNAIYYGRIVPDGSGGFTVSGQQLVVAANAKASQWTRPRMAVRPDGSTVHVVYLESDTQVKHSWRISSGAWTTEYIRNGGSNYAFPSIGVNANGTLHFIAQRWGRTSPIIYLKKPVGGAWSADVAITDTAVEYRDCAMFTDSAGGVHASWHAGNRPGYYRYAPSGTDLSAVSTLAIPLRSGVSTNAFGDIFVRADGQVHTAFATWGVEQATIDHSFRNSGGGFQTPTCASGGTIDNDDFDCWPAIAADATRVYAAWAESHTGTYFAKVKLSIKEGTAWTRYTVDETAAVYAYSKPSITLTRAGLFGVWRSNMFASGQLVLGVIAAPTTITVTAPNGGETWYSGETRAITWTSTGILPSVDIRYSTNGGNTWIPVATGTANDGTFSWTVPATPATDCRVRVSEPNGTPYDDSNASFTIVTLPPETISTPAMPAGPSAGTISVSYGFTSGGAVSNLGHALQYKFDWGDGADSGWLAAGVTQASHGWAAGGSYQVRAMARCASHVTVESLWSNAHTVNIGSCLANDRDDALATWDNQGVYYRNSDTGAWVKLATPATMITRGDLDHDCVDDLSGIGPNPGGVWVKYPKSGAWSLIASTAADIAAGDMNGDGRDDLLGTWAGQGVYYRNSASGAWVQLGTPATQLTAGDLDGDGVDDLIGVWPGQDGIWVRYSQGGTWANLSTTPAELSAGDMNGDGRDDVLASWDGQGVYYRNSASGAWVQLATPATRVAAGDLNGDGADDLIGIWPDQDGIWVRYSIGGWDNLSTTAQDIAAGRMRAAGAAGNEPPAAASMGDANHWGPRAGCGAEDAAASGPGGADFAPEKSADLEPHSTDDAPRRPGPGEAGFTCSEEPGFMPGNPPRRKP